MRILVAFYTLAVLRGTLCGNFRNDDSPGHSTSSESTSVETSLDIASLNTSICHSFDCYFDDVDETLVVPKEGHSVVKLMDGTEEVWTPSSGETFDHAHVYRNSSKEIKRMIVGKMAQQPQYACIAKDEEGHWKDCPAGWLAEEFTKLRSTPESTLNFSLDIASGNDDNCTIFEAKVFGVLAKRFTPLLGHHATEVKDGSATIWKASGEEKCLYSDVSSDGNSCLVLVALEDGRLSFKNFSKENGEWKSAPANDYVSDR